MIRSRRIAAFMLPTLAWSVVAIAQGSDTMAAAPLGPADWRGIAAYAHQVVDEESPPAAFPFDTARTGSGRAVIVAHYFPPFPLSIDNKPTGLDYYATQYLRAEGENGKFARQRGFLRERPLSVAPQPARRALAANLAVEIARAERIGIDAFGIDLLALKGPLFETARTMLTAASAVAPRYRIVPEPDMSALRDADVGGIADALAAFADQPAAYRLGDGRLLVMPFAAEARPPTFWRALIAEMAARRTPIALAPDYVDARAMQAMAPLSWGASVWGGRDVAAGAGHVAEAKQARGFGIANWFMPISPQDSGRRTRDRSRRAAPRRSATSGRRRSTPARACSISLPGTTIRRRASSRPPASRSSSSTISPLIISPGRSGARRRRCGRMRCIWCSAGSCWTPTTRRAGRR